MKKLKNKSGLTLVEMLVSLLILVFLVVGMGPGMDIASQIYTDATFESDSAMLARIINNTVGDVLRYSESIDTSYDGKDLPDDIPFVFTSYDYGIQYGYFNIPEKITENDRCIIQMKNMRNGQSMDLVNQGAYPDLEVTDFVVLKGNGDDSDLFTVSYKISSITSAEKTRDINYVVRRISN